MARKRQDVTLQQMIGRLMAQTRDAYSATGRELSQEALEERMVMVLDRAWDVYLTRSLCQGLGIDSLPEEDPSAEDEG